MQAAKKSIYELYEPSELERGFFTDADNEIRTMDSPERFLLRKTKKLAQQEEQQELQDEELSKEAEWIYENAFKTPTISVQVLMFGGAHALVRVCAHACWRVWVSGC